MRTQLKFFVVLFLIVLLGIAGCTSSGNEIVPTPTSPPESVDLPTAVPEPTAIPEPTVDPAAAVVLEMVARANAENYAGAADLVADDMMAYFIGMPPTGMEIYWGKEQFQTFLEDCCTGQHFLWEVVPERVEDGVVYARSKTWMDFTRELGVAPNSWYEMFEVKDGKITLYVSTITEEALAKFKPVIFEAIPELATAVQPPTESDQTPVSDVTITIANNTCAYDGPMTLQAGELTVNVEMQDHGWDKYAVSFFTLDEGKDMIDLMASTYNPGPPSWSNMVFLKELVPDENQPHQSFVIEEGLLYMVCWAGTPDTAIGNAGPFVVKTSSPEAVVDPAVAVVLDYAARVNAGDYAGAAELFADDAIAYLIGMPPTGMEIYWGKEQYGTFLEECCTGQHFEMEVTPVRVEEGVKSIHVLASA
jgi:ketosteroid isomerase-like protein